MNELTRRRFLTVAASFGASLVACRAPRTSALASTERRELFPEGVASGDPDSSSVILWTRRPFTDGRRVARLHVEVAEDASFTRVVGAADARVAATSDWTCRALVTGLRPAGIYFYRFVDEYGFASRVGRTRTAPAKDDGRPVRFAFVSCQNVNQGAQNAFRRMIHEDEAAPPEEQLGFVLHLGDFIYELVWYPEDRPQGMHGRRIRDIVRYASGERIEDFHVPTTVEDYRAVYRAYLHDPDIQDARARWPFVPIWDNHEFSWLGWQGMQVFNGETRPAQTRKVAANRAWFEFQPARVRMPKSTSLDEFDAPTVVDEPIKAFDDHGLGQEPNNLAAIESLMAYRSLAWGRHVELLITDQHSYRSEDPGNDSRTDPLATKDFPELLAEEAIAILDAGREFNGGKPPAEIAFGEARVPNFRRDQPAQTILGKTQKEWFLDRLRSSSATWKIWASTQGTLDGRVDPQNIPAGVTKPWPGAGYASLGAGDYGTAYRERAEIYDHVARHGITGFATVSGDRHSFWAGLAAKTLPPLPFEPVGLSFTTGSVSAPGMVEAMEHRKRPDPPHPLQALYMVDRDPTVNLLLRHGVRSCLEYARSRDIAQARALSNPDLAPHLSFVDMGGHGYAVVRASEGSFTCELVCIPRPIERSPGPDGGPLRYRVAYTARAWKAGERPSLEGKVVEGDPGLSMG